MTAISLDATPTANSLRTQFLRAVHYIGDTIDAFVAYRIRQILGEPDDGPATARPARTTDEQWYPDHAVVNITADQLKAMSQFKYN
ncbi:MAG: hypothetical protein HXX15_12845 [Rhodopseudomonas sp.]|uniref:hypothetical protein n=1 Tax=Rhodopseudomonas sp. TaxID=1078 RepID=UPI00183D7569|nr:hypothetical protein [Rhodopseudomonas sp.]NVN86961.1 hypothetical protein [Rhodopseudomonas sp.]